MHREALLIQLHERRRSSATGVRGRTETAVGSSSLRSSDLWKSGALYKQRPERLSDITDGSKFRNSFKLCGLSNDPKELRMLTSKSYTVWTLAMGIRCVPYLL